MKIPETVTAIGEGAFSNISEIKSVALPDALTDVDEDAFSAFEKATKDVTVTAKSDSAIAIAKELASKYKHLVYENETASSNQDNTTTKSDSVSVINSNGSRSITLGATIGGNAGTGSTGASTSANTTATSSTSVTLGATAGTPVTGAMTTGIGTNAVTVGETQQTTPVVSEGPTASEAIAAQKPVTSRTGSVKTAKSNATAASAPSGARHVKDSTPKTGDPIQYRMLFVCVLFSAGMLLVLTGNGRRKKVSPS